MPSLTKAFSAIDGLVYDDLAKSPTNIGIDTGRQIKAIGTVSNIVTAGVVANQQFGAIVLTKQTVTGLYAATITNTMLVATSLLFLQPVAMDTSGANPDTTGYVTATVQGRPGTGSATIAYFVHVAMAQQWTLWYEIINPV